MAEDEKKEEGIYRVETIPPPAGESDAYNAPTKVGPMPAATVAAMMQAAERKVEEVNERARAKAQKAAPASSEATERAPAAASVDVDVDVAEPVAEKDVPRVYDDDEEDRAATLLSPLAKAPVTAPTESDVVDSVRGRSQEDAPLAPPAMTALGGQRSSRLIDVLLIVLILGAAGAALWLTIKR